MPTMTSKKLVDLEAERESFILHEQRIIQERDEILKNVHSHLDQLDMEIVRLGGMARGASAIQGQASASPGDNEFVPSIAPFPSVKSVSQGKKPCGRPRKSEERVSGAENAASQKKKGKQKKEKVPTHVLIPEKENASSNNAASSSDNPKKKKARTSKNKTPAAAKNGNSNLVQVGDGKSNASKEGRSNTTDASNADDIGEPWTCECGENMAAGRKRCGKCRRWKGGKREKRWSRKSTDSTTVAAAASSGKAKAGKGGKKALKAIDVYRNLPAAQLKSSADGALVLGNEAKNDPSSEIKSIMGQMVSCVTGVAALGKKAKGSRKSGATKGGVTKSGVTKSGATKNGAKSGAVSNKRKRGRPNKKSSDETQRESIQRVVSTSDSDNGPMAEASRKRGRPMENPTVEERREQKVQSADVVGQALKQSHLSAEGTKIIAVAAEESQKQYSMNNVSVGQVQSDAQTGQSILGTTTVQSTTATAQI